jgi:hypothetical protein
MNYTDTGKPAQVVYLTTSAANVSWLLKGETMGVDSSIFQFSIYKRSDSKNWQVQFRDASNHLIPRGTGTPNKLKAYQLAADWQANGLPTTEPTIVRQLADVFNAEAIIEAIRKALLTPEEARKIVDILKERKLVDVSAVSLTQLVAELHRVVLRYDFHRPRRCIRS